MKRSKGFILAEILTGLLLQALFILVLCGAFYLLVSFGSGTQQILTARERGQRVISYVDSRIRNAGLGLSKLKKSSEYRTAFNSLINEGNKPLALNNDSKKLRLPVALTFRDKDDLTDDEMKAAEPNKTLPTNSNVLYGNILTLIYAQREEPTSQSNLVIVPVSNDNIHLVSSGDISQNSSRYCLFIDYEQNHYNFENSGTNPKRNINNWTVLTGTGIPLHTGTIDSQKRFIDMDSQDINGYYMRLTNDYSLAAKIHAGDELLHLKAERMFVCPDDNGERNFKFQELTNDWGEREPHQKDILEIYMELDKSTNIFTLYVLASGGTDGRTHERPSSWPKYARPSASNWNKSDYRYHVMYVSKASWKLHNIPDGFTWN